MFEIGVFSFIVLAIAYWTALWLMGRRDDVLHGHFVNADLQPDPTRGFFPDRQRFQPDLLLSLLTTIERDLDELTHSS